MHLLQIKQSIPSVNKFSKKAQHKILVKENENARGLSLSNSNALKTGNSLLHDEKSDMHLQYLVATRYNKNDIEKLHCFRTPTS